MSSPYRKPEGSVRWRSGARGDSARDRRKEPEKASRWRLSPQGLLVLGAVFVVVCGLLMWLKARAVLAILGATGGAFAGALVCPLVGGEDMLDDIRRDVVKCLGLGAYLVGGTWVIVVGLKGFLAQVFGSETSVSVPAGLILLLVVTGGLLARALWPDGKYLEAILITLGSVIGIFAVLSLCAAL